MPKGLYLLYVLVGIVLVLTMAVPSFATSQPVTNAGWIITQAANQSQGSATQVIACGTFSLTVTSSTSRFASSGTFRGTLSFTTAYNPSSLDIPSSVPVSGSWLTNPATGQIMVSLASNPRSTLTGSFNSPAPLPEPSTPTPPAGCQQLGSGLFGFVQMPIIQQNEGMFVYSSQQISSF